MAEEVSHELERTGEPDATLQLAQQTVAPGQELHIRMLGPQGGKATLELVPLGGDSTFEREGPKGT